MTAPAARGRRRSVAAAALVVLGLLAGAAAGLAFVPSARGAAAPIQVAVHPSSNAPSFSSGATQPLLDTRGLSALGPGGSVSGVMAVRNDSGDVGALTLVLANLDDCPSGSPAGCAGAGAALADALRFTVDVAAGPFGAARSVTRVSEQTIAQLQSGVPLATNLADGGIRWVRLTAALPPETTADAAQFGAIAFDLQLELAGVAGQTTHVIGPPSGHGTGSGAHGHGVAGLATTGLRLVALCALAALLLGAGTALLVLGRRRRGV